MSDDLADLFGASFQVTHRPNNPDAPHPRFSQYKSHGYGKLSQEERQKAFLTRQKQRRFDFLQHVRRLAEDDWIKDEEEDEEDMETQAVSRPGPRYKDQLLLSEWMLEVPPDFAEQWIMVPCPVGRRSLVVASRGQTKVYHRNGYKMNTFRSNLPGGSKNVQNWKRDNAILDCIYVEVLKTYFVLDLMCWKNHPVYDSETEFRFFWATQKLSECPEVQELSSNNQHKFHLLPQFPCQRESLEEAMKIPMTAPLDGLLFYHKSTHYTFGASPLVLWLKAYMMPELLGVPVPENYVKETPASYQNFAHHVETVDRDEYSRPKEWNRGGRRNKMETEASPGGGGKEGHGKGRGRHRKKKQVAMDTAQAENGDECDIETESSPAATTNEGHSKKKGRRRKKQVAMDTAQTEEGDEECEVEESGSSDKLDNSEVVNGEGREKADKQQSEEHDMS